jgi:hypothetical protein
VPHPDRADLAGLLEALTDAGVEFIVVGGAAAVLHGTPVSTVDLDTVHRRDDENVDRLFTLLERLDAFVREPGNRRWRPRRANLVARGQLNLITSLGPLDPMAVLHDGRDYEELVGHTELLTDGVREIRVLDLPTLIEVKSAAGRGKDRLVLPLLLALLDERFQDGDAR